MNPMNLSSMTRPKAILVATDMKDMDFVLPVAIDQARMTGAVIWLLHVLPPPVYLSLPSGTDPLATEAKQFRDAEATLARLAEQLKEQKIACLYEVRRWYPVDQIVESIRENHIDRLIVGTASRGKLGKLIIGSVAEELIRAVDIPVCTVGPHFTPSVQNGPHRMVVALSLRHHPERSLVFAAGLAAELQAELTLLNVTEQDRRDQEIAAGVESKIYELVRTVDLHPVPQVRIRSGEPAEEIVAECAALKPVALIMSAHPASVLRAKFRNGVAYRVIAQAPCPTFTLHSGAKAKVGETYREFLADRNRLSHLV
jgi:nucleotide-binding universal stress UspA family protein